MRSRVRLFVLVGLLATAVDIGVFLVLADSGLVAADVAALVLAALLSYLLNRNLTFRGHPSARWVRRPSLFALTALLAGLVDLAVLYLLDQAGMMLWFSKAVAVFAAAVIRWMAYRRILFNQVRRELMERQNRPPAPGELRLSVVIPAFNEEGLITETIATIRAELLQHLGEDDFEILVVDDGSSDATAAVASQAGARVVEQDRNRGKGAAVRTGVLAADGRAIVFTDADLAYPADLIVDVLNEVEQG